MIASTSLVVCLSSLLTLGSVSAANIDVSVGATKAGTAGLVFDPPFTAAAVGDTVTFTFHPKNHTVTQSSFGNPCALLPANTTASPPTAAGIDTGYMPVAAGTTTNLPTAVINVTTTAPLWFFCAQTGHCGQGMLFAINNATTGKTFDAYKANALANPTGAATGTGTGSSSAVTGGASSNGGAGIVSGTGGTQTTAGGATPSGSTTPAGSGAVTFGWDKTLSIAALVGLGLFTFA